MCNKQIMDLLITVKLNHGNPAQNIFHSGTKVYKDEGNLKGFFVREIFLRILNEGLLTYTIIFTYIYIHIYIYIYICIM